MMSQPYPQEERRQDHKIDDIWRSLPGLKDDIVEIKSDIVTVKSTVSKHDLALYGVKGERGETVEPGIVDIVLRLPIGFRWLMGVLTAILIAVVSGATVNLLAHWGKL